MSATRAASPRKRRFSPTAAAIRIQANRLKIAQLEAENKELTELVADAGDKYSWDGWVAEVTKTTRTKVNEKEFLEAIGKESATKWTKSVLDTDKIKVGVEVGALENTGWLTTSTTRSVRITPVKGDPGAPA